MTTERNLFGCILRATCKNESGLGAAKSHVGRVTRDAAADRPPLTAIARPTTHTAPRGDSIKTSACGARNNDAAYEIHHLMRCVIVAASAARSFPNIKTTTAATVTRKTLEIHYYYERALHRLPLSLPFLPRASSPKLSA